jgi:hypothetical protein
VGIRARYTKTTLDWKTRKMRIERGNIATPALESATKATAAAE